VRIAVRIVAFRMSGLPPPNSVSQIRELLFDYARQVSILIRVRDPQLIIHGLDQVLLDPEPGADLNLCCDAFRATTCNADHVISDSVLTYFSHMVGPNWGEVFFLGRAYPVVFKYSIPSKAEWVTVAPASDLARTFAARAGGIMAQCA
jgi:hypothetical protein